MKSKNAFKERFTETTECPTPSCERYLEGSEIKSLESTKNIYGITRKRNWRKETCWWSISVENVIKEKRHKLEACKKGEIIKEECLKARHAKPR